MKPIPVAVTAWTLQCLLISSAVSAAIGAFLALVLGGGGFPVELLHDTPFTSPAIPGVLLGLGVGGPHLLAAVALQRRSASAMLLSAVAGTSMMIWIFAEVAFLDGFHWLQAFYFAVGLFEILLVLALLGIRPAVAAPGTSAGARDFRLTNW